MASNVNYKCDPPELIKKDDEFFKNFVSSFKERLLEKIKIEKLEKMTVLYSGGVDSTVTLSLLNSIFKNKDFIEVLFLPGFFTSEKSYDLSYAYPKELGIKLLSTPIKFIQSTISNSYLECCGSELSVDSKAVLQKSIREIFVKLRSLETRSLIVDSATKTELLLNNKFIFNKHCSVFTPFESLYKSEIRDLADYLQKISFNLPIGIDTFEAKKELYESEKGLSKNELIRFDTLLESYFEDQKSIIFLQEAGFSKTEVDKIR